MPLQLTSLPSWILSSAATRSHQMLHRELERAGVNGYEYRCLLALSIKPAMSQAELGAAAVLDPRDVTHTVRALEERDLIVRAKDPSHGRKVLVSLTELGRETAETLEPIMTEAQDKIFQRLSDEERSVLVTLLTQIG